MKTNSEFPSESGRLDAELLWYDRSPDEEVHRSLEGLARAGARAVALLGLGWEGSMSCGLSLAALARPASDEDRALARRCRGFVEAARGLGLLPRLFLAALEYPGSLLEERPEFFGEGVAAGVRCEFDAAGDGRRERPACPASEGFWRWHEELLRGLFRALPGLSGLTLFPSEGRCDVWACRCARCAGMGIPDRLLELIRRTRSVVIDEQHGELEVRTYLSGWRLSRQPDFWLPLQGRIPEDVTVAFRGQFGDDHYLNPLHPFVQRFRHPRRALVVDLYNEKRGYAAYPCAIPAWLSERIKAAAAAGVRTVVGRVDPRVFHPEAGRFIGLNLAAAAALVRDPARPPRAVSQAWAAERFGPKAAPLVADLLEEGERAVRGALYAKGLPITSHSHLPENWRRLQYIVADYAGRCHPEASRALDRTAEDLPALLAEKDEALAGCERALRRIEEDGPLLEPADAELLRAGFERLRAFARVLREVAAVFFLLRRRERAWSIMDREVLRHEALAAASRLRAAAPGLEEAAAARAKGLAAEAEALLAKAEVYERGRSPIFNAYDPERDRWEEHLRRMEELGL